MKVGALIQGFWVPSSRYRFLQYVPHLEAAGISSEARPFPETARGWRETLAWVRELDLLFLHRKRPNPWRLWTLRRAARRIVYDLDDAVMYRDTLSLGRQESLSRRLRFASVVKAADWVIAGNRYLEGKVLEYTDQVSVLPTAVDLGRYSPRRWDGASGPVVMGWIGDTGSVAYLESQRDLFEAIGKACPGSSSGCSPAASRSTVISVWRVSPGARRSRRRRSAPLISGSCRSRRIPGRRGSAP